jgi:hypothetical protein
MTVRTIDRPLLAAAVGYAAAAAYGARVDVREEVLGEPFGIRLRGRVAIHLALAWGAGTSPPWPMPVAVLALGRCARPDVRVGTASIALGAATAAGQLIEPVAWGRRPSSPAITRAIALNLAACGALVLAGRRTTLTARRSVR